MKAVVAAFNQEKALVGAFSVITNLRMQLFEALVKCVSGLKLKVRGCPWPTVATVVLCYVFLIMSGQGKEGRGEKSRGTSLLHSKYAIKIT